MDQTMADMFNARKLSSIDVNAVRNLIWAGSFANRHNIIQILASDPSFDKSKRPFLPRTERFQQSLNMIDRLAHLRNVHGWSDQEFALAMNLIDDFTPLTLHLTAFQPVILSQGSPEQVLELSEKVKNLAIIGAYAQTELGHGSNVAKLETTATYMPESDQFEINSAPTLTSTKWWAGGMGKTATHAVVQARLILPTGKDMGPHLFFVQLRSLEDHSALEGIKLGDIGPKAFGSNPTLDNGYARFDRVRIPRNAMLSKFAQVTREGAYVQPPHAKLSYGGMIYIRSSMITSSGVSLAKGITIGIRYCTVRRQGGQDGSLERQVISYPSTYIRLLPILSQAYVFMLLGKSMTDLFESMSSKLSTGDTSLLAETHSTSSGLKSFVTRHAVDSLAVVRASLGGHGYSAFAGVGRIWGDAVPSMTYEGDNYVLDQQVTRAAMKAYGRLHSRRGTELSPSAAYLQCLVAGKEPAFAKDLQWNDAQVAVEILEWRAALMVRASAAQGKTGGTQDAGEQHRLSFAIMDAFIARRVSEIIQSLASGNMSPSQRDSRIVSDLLLLYLLSAVESALSDILELCIVRADTVKHLRAAISSLCQTLLPEAIGLTDAFGFTDWELDSALGVYDGNVYQELWNRAQSEPLNGTDESISEGHRETIKKILRRGESACSGSAKSKL